MSEVNTNSNSNNSNSNSNSSSNDNDSSKDVGTDGGKTALLLSETVLSEVEPALAKLVQMIKELE